MIKGNRDNNITYLKESKYIIQNRELLIKRRKRKRLIIRLFFITSLLGAIFTTLLFKLPYFSIKYIIVIDNNNIRKEDIIKLSKIKVDTNIFNINKKKSLDNILNNPYILSADLKRKLPNKIVIKVKERKASFYVNKGSRYYVVDKDSIVLEEKDNISSMRLTKLTGFDNNNLEVGQVLPFNNEKKLQVIQSITEIFSRTNSDVQMSILDVTQIYDIKAYYGNICVKLGDSDELENKLSKAISVIKNENLQGKKGYVDVSFKGNPVFFIEN